MDLELTQNGNTVHLYYEDRMHGKDRLFVLSEDGAVYEADYNEHDDEVLTKVDLVAELRAMVMK